MQNASRLADYDPLLVDQFNHVESSDYIFLLLSPISFMDACKKVQYQCQTWATNVKKEKEKTIF